MPPPRPPQWSITDTISRLSKDASTHTSTTIINYNSSDIFLLSSSLTHNTNLTSIKFKNCSVGTDGSKGLRDALGVNEGLEEIAFDECLLTGKIGKRILQGLGYNIVNCNVESITMTRCDFDDLSVSYLVDCVSSLESLTELNLSHNKISDNGCHALSNLLLPTPNKLSTLKVLNLSHNRINDSGAISIATVLERNRVLNLLDLGFNNIGNEGGVALAFAFDVSKVTLEEDFSNTTSDDDGGVDVKHDVKHGNRTLSKLYLNNNRLGSIVAIKFLQIFDITNENESNVAELKKGALAQLNLSFNNIGDVGHNSLRVLSDQGLLVVGCYGIVGNCSCKMCVVSGIAVKSGDIYDGRTLSMIIEDLEDEILGVDDNGGYVRRKHVNLDLQVERALANRTKMSMNANAINEAKAKAKASKTVVKAKSEKELLIENFMPPLSSRASSSSQASSPRSMIDADEIVALPNPTPTNTNTSKLSILQLRSLSQKATGLGLEAQYNLDGLLSKFGHEGEKGKRAWRPKKNAIFVDESLM